MTLEEIYYIGQTIAVVAIIGSLIALIMQNNQAHVLARDTAMRHQFEGVLRAGCGRQLAAKGVRPIRVVGTACVVGGFSGW